MILNKRERVLAFVMAALLIAFFGWYGVRAVGDPLGELSTRKAELARQLKVKTKDKEDLEKAKERLEDWRRRSLPSDAESARVLYRDWLSDLASKFSSFNLDRPQEIPQRDFYKKLHFVIHVQGTLEQLTRFLYGFYSAGHLHMVHSLLIEPVEKSGELKLTITVEALILAGADRRNELSKEPGKRLASADVGAYKVIAERNVFAPSSPPKQVVERKEAPPKVETFDPSKHTYFSGVVEEDGKPAVWLLSRTTGEGFVLHVGDPVEVGLFKGQIARIGVLEREVEIKIEGDPKPYVVPIGENLRGTEGAAKSVAPEQPEPKPDGKSPRPPEPKRGEGPEARSVPKSGVKPEGPPNGKMDFRRSRRERSKNSREPEK